jgi:hypothetical protein
MASSAKRYNGEGEISESGSGYTSRREGAGTGRREGEMPSVDNNMWEVRREWPGMMKEKEVYI